MRSPTRGEEKMRRTQRTGSRLPPGPRLPKWLQTVLALHDPVGFFERCRQRHGEVFRIDFIGIPPVAYVGDPDLAHEVFTTDRGIGQAGEARKPFLEPLVGVNSLICLDGDDWMRQRRLLGSAFHGKRIERYREDIAAIAAAYVREWPTATEIRLRPRIQVITLEIILRVVFGVRDTRRVERLHELLPPLLASWESVNSLISILPRSLWARVEPILARVPRNPVAKFTDLFTETDQVLYTEIAERRDADDLQDRADILSVLMRARDDDGSAMTDLELRDALMTLIVAGHETTATGLAWAFERLVRNPQVLDRLTRAIDGEDDDRGYLDAVIKETLRTRPVGPDMPRYLTGPLELGGYRIPAGWWVNPSATLLHNMPDHFPDPDDFRPERFLEEDPPAWMPFGGGRRKCLGAQLAMLEMQAVIPAILDRYRVRMAGDDAPEKPLMRYATLVPSQDGRIRADRR
ncbi:cytochrome P450 [Actinomadura darangshiensis]|uniref:Cytochrome P450 n=1 Tax=Actinomadura darangshiensis TaxID=705336 RepID=A0A4R5C7J7_9ACTN|nr:cytochrome P450 [Actinomadura darangshiensis]TDD92932.1 cytochrome P450 [Actinomadura darangshiensis]